MTVKVQRILGLDPGYGRLGFGVIEVNKGSVSCLGCGLITTPVGKRQAARLLELAEDIQALIKKFKPDVVAIEILFFSKNVTTGLKVAEVRGVILLLAEKAGLEIVEVRPNEVKLALTGYGKADKKQMQQMITKVLCLPKVPKPDDAADALAIAWTAIGRVAPRR